MHHEIVDNFKNNEKSKQLVCNFKKKISLYDQYNFKYYCFIFSAINFLLNFMRFIGFV